ncbi:MAG: prepilin-type N-terminal cleavage/methylation domain-containing protein [Fimbriimonadaceae bacterium]|nr:prepilin-type N-terminal cleavage/methylation domain-containing protein [Fimbriimonadaceae bacterium]
MRVVKGDGRRPRRRQGLTLVETLIVVGVIVVLASLIFLGARWGVGGAKRSACATNLRQLGVAIELYAEGADGQWPPYYSLEPFDPEAGAAPWRRSLRPFVAAEEIFFCPADNEAGRPPSSTWLRMTEHTSYVHSLNTLGTGRKDVPGLPQNGLQVLFSPRDAANPSECIGLTDWAVVEPDTDLDSSARQGSALKVRTPHQDGGNRLMLDLRVEFATLARVAKEGGRCLPAGSNPG